jgi:hypothetical protein
MSIFVDFYSYLMSNKTLKWNNARQVLQPSALNNKLISKCE